MMLRVLSLLSTAALSGSVNDALQEISTQVSAQQDQDEKTHNKAACWCEATTKTMSQAIGEESRRTDRLEHEIAGMRAREAQYHNEIESHSKDVEQSQTSLDTAAALRNKAEDAFQKDEEFHKTSLDSLDDGLDALEKRSLTATQVMATVHRLVAGAPEALKKKGAALLQGIDDPSYGAAIGVMKSMKTHFKESLEEARAREAREAEQFDGMRAAKKAELDAASKSLSTKKRHLASTTKERVDAEQEMSDTQAMLDVDRPFLVGIKQACKGLDESFVERTAKRNNMAVSLSSSLAALASDHARDTFNKHMIGLSLRAKRRTASVSTHLNPAGEEVATVFKSLGEQFPQDKPIFEKVAGSLIAGDTKRARKDGKALVEDLRAQHEQAKEAVASCHAESNNEKTNEEAASAENDDVQLSLSDAAEDVAQIEGSNSGVQEILSKASDNAANMDESFQTFAGQLHMMDVRLQKVVAGTETQAKAHASDAQKLANELFNLCKTARQETRSSFGEIAGDGKKALAARHRADVNQRMVKAERQEDALAAKDEVEFVSKRASIQKCQMQEETLRQVESKLSAAQEGVNKVDDDLFWSNEEMD